MSKIEHFVTLFDYRFAPQGLALYQSLKRLGKPFCLWIVCMDEEVHRLLDAAQLPGIKAISQADWEDDRFSALRRSRKWREYCWTITPFTFDFVFSRSDALRVTYLDADLWIYGDYSALFRSLDRLGKSVLITEHAYAPIYDMTWDHGRFCVQFLSFSRAGTAQIRKKWQQQCEDWCFDEPVEGKFGDQKYLDDWPEVYPEHVLVAPKSKFLGPWNAMRFPYGQGIAYHFHQTRVNYKGKDFRIGRYQIPAPTFDNLYRNYLKDIDTAHHLMVGLGFSPLPQFSVAPGFRTKIGSFVRSLWRPKQNEDYFSHSQPRRPL